MVLQWIWDYTAWQVPGGQFCPVAEQGPSLCSWAGVETHPFRRAEEWDKHTHTERETPFSAYTAPQRHPKEEPAFSFKKKKKTF